MGCGNPVRALDGWFPACRLPKCPAPRPRSSSVACRPFGPAGRDLPQEVPELLGRIGFVHQLEPVLVVLCEHMAVAGG